MTNVIQFPIINKKEESNEETVDLKKYFFNPLDPDSTEMICNVCNELFSVYEGWYKPNEGLVQCSCCAIENQDNDEKQ